jgi:hypothetical protein
MSTNIMSQLFFTIIIFTIYSCSDVENSKQIELNNYEEELKKKESDIKKKEEELNRLIQKSKKVVDNKTNTKSENRNNLSNTEMPASNKRYQHRFAFVYISYYEDSGGRIIDGVNPKSYSRAWTPIQEFYEWNEDVKYRFMDEAESKLFFRSIKTITSRECYDFSTYSEASKHLEKLKNN